MKDIFLLATNTFWQGLARGSSVLISFLTLTVLTRYLGTSGYGNFNLVFTYLSFFGVLADLGINLLFVREHSKTSGRVHVTHFFVSKIILVFLALVLSLFFIPFLPYEATVKTGLIIGALAVSIGYLNGFGYSILQAKVKLNVVALYETLNRIVTAALLLLFVFLNFGFIYIISAVLLGNLVSLCIGLFTIEGFLPQKVVVSGRQVKDLIFTAIPIGITAVFSALYFRLDTLLLSFFRTPEDVGIYSLAYKLFENILVLWGLYMASVYPLAAKYYHLENKKNFHSLIRTTIFVLIGASGLAILIGYQWGMELILFLSGKDFSASFPVFKILLLAVPFFLLNNVFYHLLLVSNKVRLIIYAIVTSFLLNLVFNIYLIPQFGYRGAAVTTFLTEVVLVLIYLVILKTQKIFR